MAKAKKQETTPAIVPSEIEAKDLSAVMEAEASKRELITQYIARHMKSGTDYGTIKFGGKESKPSLFKPGSEKFLSLFKLTAKFEKDTDTWEMAGSEKGVFAYKCQLVASNGNIVGEGRGVSKLTEKQGWTINNAVKIAEKRAQIDAVLRTGALSDFFTQDLEDMAQTYDNSPVEDDAPVVVSGADAEPKPKKEKRRELTETDKKKIEIKELIDKKIEGVGVPCVTGDDYRNYVKENLGLELEAWNFEKIITGLKAL